MAAWSCSRATAGRVNPLLQGWGLLSAASARKPELCKPRAPVRGRPGRAQLPCEAAACGSGGKKCDSYCVWPFPPQCCVVLGYLGPPRAAGRMLLHLLSKRKEQGKPGLCGHQHHAVMVFSCVQALLGRLRFLRSSIVTHRLVWRQGWPCQAEDGASGASPADTLLGAGGKSQAAPRFLGLEKAVQRGRTSLFPSQ